MIRMLRRLMCAASRSAEPSGRSSSRLVIRASRSQSSILDRRISSYIVSTLIFSSIVFRPRQSRPSGGGPSDGGGGCIACDRNEEEECFSTCGHQPTNGAIRPEARTGLVRWDGGRRVLSVSRELRAQSELALAPEEPLAAATAILWIEAFAAEFFAKPLSVRRIGETENVVRDVVPMHRVPARTKRKPTAEFVDEAVVFSNDLISPHCDLIPP